ncbi:hypothetical protein GTR02_01945 [Kineococcus sp. R8]|uniref:hypothetical protein n=1 Tax=Kineococcus siccus TaxID=2696567 RepID=UPI00141204ED|nr:hypothetical protein [Kineococcus siccus]NAZ80581.1 hypothetical protein [Kineococcus siccus]
MSFDKTTWRTAADTARQRAERQVAKVQANPNLSDAGKARALARLFTQHREELAQLQAEMNGRAAQTARQLERQLFGTSDRDGQQDAISRRDAEDRATQLAAKPAQAQAVMARALRNGDMTLANAIAEVAHTQAQAPIGSAGWSEVMDLWLEARPDAAPQLQELVSVAAPSIQDNFIDGALFRPAKPIEIASLTDGVIEALAQASDAAIPAPMNYS